MHCADVTKIDLVDHEHIGKFDLIVQQETMSHVAPAIPVRFDVIHNDELADATLDFSTNDDVLSAARWRLPRHLVNIPGMRARAADAREFAQLAAKRWKHYRDTRTAAFSFDDLSRKIVGDPEGEFCFHLNQFTIDKKRIFRLAAALKQ